ncbi:MAG TPA: 50S ribosomal protein L23 [Patescibacteria group bacterium]|nr:50S ribosomal protein L23 [Patescibacteria group bacterium]
MNVILSPVVTEKSVEDMKKGKYAFKVVKGSNKLRIKRSVEEGFGVNVLRVSTINVKKLIKTTNQRKKITIPGWKKAIVEIKSGQKIDIFGTGGKK